MPTVHIHASDVAACIGKHPYQNASDVLAKYARRIRREADASVALVEDALRKLPAEAVARIQALDDGGILETDTLRARLDESIEAVEGCEVLACGERALLREHCRSTAFTSFGTHRESDALDRIASTNALGVAISRGDGCYRKRYLFTQGRVHVFVGGKVDASTSDGRFVEVKNRVRRLFGEVRQYERVQALSYGFIGGGVDGWIVECFEGQVRSYEVPYDNGYWERDVVPGLKSFIESLRVDSGLDAPVPPVAPGGGDACDRDEDRGL